MNSFNYNSHLKTHHHKESKYTCDLCHNVFRWKQSLKRHQNSCKSLKENDDARFKCSYCPCMFIWKKSLKKHITDKHNITAEHETYIDKNTNNIMEECNYCSKHYKSVKARVKHEKMKHHITTAKLMGTFPCPQCSKMFVWSKSLTRHLNAYH